MVRGSGQWPEFAKDHGFRYHKAAAARHIDVFMNVRHNCSCMELMLPSSQSTTGWLLLEQGDLAGRRYCFETNICPSPVCLRACYAALLPRAVASGLHPCVPGNGFGEVRD